MQTPTSRLAKSAARPLLSVAALLWCVAAAPVLAQEPAAKGKGRGIDTRLVDSPVKEDFDGLVKNLRAIRVAAPYSRSLFFNDKGRTSGISADFVREFEHYINQKHKKELGKRPITVMIRPTTRDVLLSSVADGLADIAVGNLTVTEDRLKTVDFVSPADRKPVSELVLTGPKSAPIATADDLSGKMVHVRRSASYHDSLVALNDRLQKAGKTPVELVLVPDALEDEDMMEMLNVGLFEAIVVDDWKARMWAQVLPKIKVNEGAIVREAGKIGWAIRKGSPKLAAELEEFYAQVIARQGGVEKRVMQYHRRIRQLKDPTASASRKRFDETLELFRKYGERYRFDALMLAAQGYQESQLNQEARSHVGAIGIMQIMPATGEELRVGDVTLAEPNVHGGAKYMDQLMRALADGNFDETNRTLFAFACYNAGPGKIARMRKEAEKRGLDKDKWFNNVELVVAEKIGAETTTYVRNIYKYYVAYTLLVEREEALRKTREGVTPGK
jgi:membrane-bound lytic murein transglycosylase MltF